MKLPSRGQLVELIWITATNMLSSASLSQQLSSRSASSIGCRRTMKTSLASSLIILAACSQLTGCASIVSGRYADVAVDSYPTNANVLIRDDNGRTVAALTTPGVVSLKRNRRYFLPARYTAVIDAPGYEPAQVPIRSTVNPWVLGNVVVGGIPGLVVDNATGAAWRPKCAEIHRQLTPVGGGSEQPTDQPSPSEPVSPAQYSTEQADAAADSAIAKHRVATSASAL
jgi:hypothetical protein